jgi:WD40 repeat protein
LGTCIDTWSWAQNGNDFAVKVSPAQVAVYRNGVLRRIRLSQEQDSPHLGMSDAGLVVATDAAGNGAFLLPGADDFQHVQLGQRPTSTSAFGTALAWGFPDGSVKIFDTKDSREWTIKAHAQSIHCLRLLPPGDRLLTCSDDEFRLWRLPDDAPIVHTQLPAAVFNVALDQAHNALFDGAGGAVYMKPRQSLQPILLHQHSLLAFGVAWCDSRACSASWDGHVLCSSVDASHVTLDLDLGAPVRWLAESDGHCFAAVANGGIYDLEHPAVPIYQHALEPYRMAVSADGDLVASGDWGGALKIWSIRARRLVGEYPHLHHARIMDMAWNATGLVTASADGTIKLLNKDLREADSWNVGSSVRYMATFDNSVIAALGDGDLWFLSPLASAPTRLSMGSSFTAFAVQDKTGTVAVGNSEGEVIVVYRDHRLAAYQFGHGLITGLAFESDGALLVCAPAGRILRVNLSLHSDK